MTPPPYILLIIGFLLTILMILVLLYNNRKIDRQANRQLAAQKQELQLAQAKLKQTQGQLIQAEKMASLGELTAGIAHEINNPLNFVTTNAHALKLDLQEINHLLEEVHKLQESNSESQIQAIIQKIKALDTEFLRTEIQQLVDSIERGVVRTQNIVAGLRIFSRKACHDSFMPADIHEGLESTITILNSKLKNRILIKRHYSDLPPIPCQFDKLNQVFMNILNNAIQAIKAKGEIHITTQLLDEVVAIKIKDTGSGMCESIKQRIFEPFFTTKEVGKGTGLGLSISLGIIDAHEGRLEVNSEIGKGSEFVVYLPLKQKN